jgi:hypothetical protein
MLQKWIIGFLFAAFSANVAVAQVQVEPPRATRAEKEFARSSPFQINWKHQYIKLTHVEGNEQVMKIWRCSYQHCVPFFEDANNSCFVFNPDAMAEEMRKSANQDKLALALVTGGIGAFIPTKNSIGAKILKQIQQTLIKQSPSEKFPNQSPNQEVVIGISNVIPDGYPTNDPRVESKDFMSIIGIAADGSIEKDSNIYVIMPADPLSLFKFEFEGEEKFISRFRQYFQPDAGRGIPQPDMRCTR